MAEIVRTDHFPVPMNARIQTPFRAKAGHMNAGRYRMGNYIVPESTNPGEVKRGKRNKRVK